MRHREKQLENSQRVLVIEDDLSLQPLWTAVLKRCFGSPEIEWSVSGEEARKMMKSSTDMGCPYDLVISDIFLSGNDTGLDIMSSQELALTGAKFVLVSVAEEEKIRGNFPVKERVVMTKPLNVNDCVKTICALMAVDFGREAA